MMSQANILSGPTESSVPEESMGKYFYDRLRTSGYHNIINIDANEGHVLTAGRMLDHSVKLATILKSRTLERGDVISIISENTIEYCLPVLAALYIGVTVNPLNPDYSVGELKHALNLNKPKLIFCSENVLENVIKVKSEADFTFTVILLNQESEKSAEIQNVKDLIAAEDVDVASFKPDEFDCCEQVAFICQSSGTTGLPKGVLLTHENLRTPIGYLSDPRYGNLTSEDISIGVLPFFHIFGLVLQIAAIVTRSELVIMKKFQPEVFLRCIQEHQVTKLYIVPPLLLFLLNHPLVEDYNISSIKHIVCGGASLGRNLQEHVANRFPRIKIRQVYGLTETCGACTFQTEGLDTFGSVGGLIPNILAKVVDLETGQTTGVSTTGEICFKGSMIMKGYVGDPLATEASMDEDGFYHTGDVGYYDKTGCFYIVDRVKELIKYKGFQVPPAELEALINTHPGVKESCVIGIPDERAGQLPLAYVVKKPDATVTEQEIINFVAENISVQKHLYGGVKFVDEIPKNPSGKLLRRVLIDMYFKSK